MTDRPQNEMTCSQFEALLADALDGLEVRPGDDELAALPAAMRRPFLAHRLSCPDCGPMYAEAREGMLLLRRLEDMEPPRNLVHNILAVTSRAALEEKSTDAVGVQESWAERMRRRWAPSFVGVLRTRFVASFCMAFFSLSLTLSLTGIKLTDLARMASHPTELRKSVVLEYTQMQARVMRYYDNMRLVYEAESFGRELKKAAAPVQNQDKGTAQPDQQNLIRPEPVVPDFKEVVQPEERNAFELQRDRAAREVMIAYHVTRLPDLRKLSAHEIAEFMRKTEGVQI